MELSIGLDNISQEIEKRVKYTVEDINSMLERPEIHKVFNKLWKILIEENETRDTLGAFYGYFIYYSDCFDFVKNSLVDKKGFGLILAIKDILKEIDWALDHVRFMFHQITVKENIVGHDVILVHYYMSDHVAPTIDRSGYVDALLKKRTTVGKVLSVVHKKIDVDYKVLLDLLEELLKDENWKEVKSEFTKSEGFDKECFEKYFEGVEGEEMTEGKNED